MNDNEKHEVALALGFTIEHANSNRPFLRYLDGEGALSRHGRPPTEAEMRMWHMLIDEPYTAWSGTSNSATSATLFRLGVGVPKPKGGSTPDRGGAGS